MKMSNSIKRNKTLPSYNSAITIVNMLDELDWVIGGYGNPTASFLHTFNTFVESFVLIDHFIVTNYDAQHSRLISPFFPHGRPIMEIVSNIYQVAVDQSEHFRGSEGVIVYPFIIEDGKTLNTDKTWFEKYKNKVIQQDVAKIIPFYEIGEIPCATPLLIILKVKKGNCAVGIFQRDVRKLLKSKLDLAHASHYQLFLPIYGVRAQIDYYSHISASIDLYRKLAELYRVRVEKLLQHIGYFTMPIPPLTTILLTRCKSRDDIPEQLLRLRAEMSPLREAARIHEDRLYRADNLGEQFDAISEFDQFWQTFSVKLKTHSNRIIYRFGDIVKEANPIKWATKSLDKAIEWDQQRLILNRYQSLLDIWNNTRDLPPVHKQIKEIERIFGKSITSDEWQKYVMLANEIEVISFPNGRRKSLESQL